MQFLLSRLEQQAMQDGVSLTDLEKRMFLFSETYGQPDWEAQEKFDSEIDHGEYESKIVKLLRRAYSHDKRSPDEMDSWRDALTSVRDIDFYGLVMVDLARIPRAKPSVGVLLKAIVSGVFRMENPVYLFLKVVMIVFALIAVFDPMHWGLIPRDWQRWACVAMAVLAIWLLGQFERAQVRESPAKKNRVERL